MINLDFRELEYLRTELGESDLRSQGSAVLFGMLPTELYEQLRGSAYPLFSTKSKDKQNIVLFSFTEEELLAEGRPFKTGGVTYAEQDQRIVDFEKFFIENGYLLTLSTIWYPSAEFFGDDLDAYHDALSEMLGTLTECCVGERVYFGRHPQRQELFGFWSLSEFLGDVE